MKPIKPVCASDPWSKLALGASAHFESLHRGQPTLPRTPLYKQKTTQAILDDWLDILKKYSRQYPATVEYDLSRVSKYGPRGGYPPWSERGEELLLYANRLKRVDLENPLLVKAIEKAREMLGIPKFAQSSLRPLSPETVLRRDTEEDKLNSNSGAPDYSKRRNPEVQANAIADAKSGKWSTYPYVLAERTQRHGKTRFIFMAPMSSNLREKGYLVPLQDRLRANHIDALLAWEGFDETETYGPLETDTEYVSTDFVGMDQTVGPMQLEIVFKLFEGVFQNEREMRAVLSYCLTAKVQIEYLKAWCPTIHGLPSGAGGTNFLETMLAVVMHCLAELIQGVPHRFQVLGDDGIAFGQKGLCDALVKAATMMGFEMNPSKQRTSHTDYVYLQRYFNPSELHGQGAYPTVLALNACVYPERFHDPRVWGPRMETLRWIMILENCKHHPAFTDLIEYVRKGDKYKLDLGPNIRKLYKQAKAIPGFVPSYNQASLNRDITDFEVVKYLQTHR